MYLVLLEEKHMDRITLKTEAKKALKNNWTWAVVLTLLTGIIAGLLSWITSGFGSIIVSFLMIGFYYSFLDLLDGKKEDNYFTAMFSAFTKGRFVPVLLTWLLTAVFTFLWSLLLIVPGIIKALSYSQAFFITKDMVDSGQDVAPTEAITKSRQLMHGHKMEYFVLQLSFLGWAILACLTLGIGFLWLKPYINTTNAAYYRKLAGDKYRVVKTVETTTEVAADNATKGAEFNEQTESTDSDKPAKPTENSESVD